MKNKTAEEILSEYVKFTDVNQSELISLLPLTIVDMMEEYASQFSTPLDEKRIEELAEEHFPNQTGTFAEMPNQSIAILQRRAFKLGLSLKQPIEEKVQFIVDGKHLSKEYSILQLLNKDEESIIEDMEVCDCQFNESRNFCEGDCYRFENSKITGYKFSGSVSGSDFIQDCKELNACFSALSQQTEKDGGNSWIQLQDKFNAFEKEYSTSLSSIKDKQQEKKME